MRPILLVAALAAVSTNLSAAAINATFNGLAAGSTSAVERIISDSATGTQAWTSLTMGLFSFTRTGGDYTGTLQPGPGNNFLAFCVEPQELAQSAVFQVVGLPAAVTNLGGIGATRADQLSRLMGTYYPNFGGVVTATQVAALQIAIWEIVRENSGTLNVTAGTTQFRNATDAASLTLAQSYLTNIAAGGGTASSNFVGLNSVGAQDMLVRVSDVPEPSTLAMLGLSIAPLALLSRRKRK